MEATQGSRPRRRKAVAVLLWTLGIVAALGAGGYAAWQASPWPSALLVRLAFDANAARLSKGLAKYVPDDVSARLDEHYRPGDPDAYLDVYYPSGLDGTMQALPTVVWVHGGGWVSGSKADVANYAKILAGKGYTVAAVNYSIAPGATYPTPLKQVSAALAYLDKHAERLHVDTSRIFLAGDSAGAQIAAQVANLISSPAYARELGIAPPLRRSQLAGAILYCGAYDLDLVNMDGPFRGLLQTMLWSYSGTRRFMHDPALAPASVLHYVTPDFPPAFVSAGNDDPLAPQSKAFAEALAHRGVEVDSLFFARDYRPELPHEYQFDLDTEAGQVALARSVEFLKRHSGRVEADVAADDRPAEPDDGPAPLPRRLMIP